MLVVLRVEIKCTRGEIKCLKGEMKDNGGEEKAEELRREIKGAHGVKGE